MWKRIRRILMILLAAVFAFCAISVGLIQLEYRKNRKVYREASEIYTAVSTAEPQIREEEPLETAPKKVDFRELLAVNPDIVGWLYCEDTIIDYPVAQGTDNDLYLTTGYDLKFNGSGCLFVDAYNQRDFRDPNSIIYGHHMANGSMFATLEKWQFQDYFDEHPTMWLLTPTQDYKVELFSAYNISAYDGAYYIFHDFGMGFTASINLAISRSMVQSGVDCQPEDHYIMLSTCAYFFEDARSVLHGRLVPVDSAGGEPICRG